MVALEMAALPPPQWIDTAEGLAAWAGRCAKAAMVAIDTESDSFHHYREKVCLVQMTVGGEDAIIDPLALEDLEPLARVMHDPKITKIFHDACYDLICLRRDFRFEVRGLFDTMLASRLLGERSFGLAAILRERFNHESNKRLQRSDWAARPLSAEQISYARFDTHFLEPLTEMLTADLAKVDRLEWAREDFTRLPDVAERIAARPAVRNADGFWRIRGIRTLSPEVLGRVRALHGARDKIARRLDRPPFKIFGDSVLVDLAKSPPHDIRDLQPRRGLRRGGIERFGREIMQALRKATVVKESPPSNVRPRRRSGRFLDPRARERYEALRKLRKAKADELGLEPEVALSNAVLEEVARLPSTRRAEVKQIAEFSGWRGPVFTQEVIELLGRRKSKG